MQFKVESSELEFQELVEKRKQEIKLEVNKKIDKIRFWYVMVELVVMISGYAMLVYFTSWQIALAIFLVQTSDSMRLTRTLNKEKSFWKIIWRL